MALRTALIAALCTVVVSAVRAQDYPKPMDNAAFVYSALVYVNYLLTECADYDKQNAGSYNKVMSQYSLENSGNFDRLMTIMRTETIRSGYSLESLNVMLSAFRKQAIETTQEQRRDGAKFLSICQAQPEAHNRGLAAYRPLRERFPAQMRIIDQWK